MYYVEPEPIYLIPASDGKGWIQDPQNHKEHEEDGDEDDEGQEGGD